MKNILIVFALISAVALSGATGTSYADPSALAEPHIETDANIGVETIKGKVLETMNSGGYTYINIGHDASSTWVAVPITPVQAGQEVEALPGFVMNDFNSKTLGRTFETIVFSGGLAGAKASAPAPAKAGGAHGGMAPAKKVENVKVEKASGPDAYTVAELHAKRGELDTKKIVLRGQVVKMTPAIMKKNWIHIKDGSGSASDGTDDMVVTSQDSPSVGDIVTVKGTLYKDKDFGMGYFYGVIVEEATIEK